MSSVAWVCSWAQNHVWGLHNPKAITRPGELPLGLSVPGARAVVFLVWSWTMCAAGLWTTRSLLS